MAWRSTPVCPEPLTVQPKAPANIPRTNKPQTDGRGLKRRLRVPSSDSASRSLHKPKHLDTNLGHHQLNNSHGLQTMLGKFPQAYLWMLSVSPSSCCCSFWSPKAESTVSCLPWISLMGLRHAAAKQRCPTVGAWALIHSTSAGHLVGRMEDLAKDHPIPLYHTFLDPPVYLY